MPWFVGAALSSTRRQQEAIWGTAQGSAGGTHGARDSQETAAFPSNGAGDENGDSEQGGTVPTTTFAHERAEEDLA